VRCIIDRRDQGALEAARKLGWPMRQTGHRVEIDLPDDWAARLVVFGNAGIAAMGVFGEGVRQGKLADAEGR